MKDMLDILCAKTVKDNQDNQLCYESSHCRFILDVLEQFEIGFPIPQSKNQRLLIPALLPSDTPVHGFPKPDALAFDFDFSGFLPRHVMPGFIVRRHREIAKNGSDDKEMVWQNGVRLKSNNLDAEALAQADYHERRISLWVRGKQASRYFSALHDDILQMLARMQDLRFSEWVRLPGGDQTRRADFRQLLTMEAHGQHRYFHADGNVYAVSDLLKIMPLDERPAKIINNYKIEGNMGDTHNYGGVSNSVINIKSRLDNVHQSIQTIPNTSQDEQQKLQDLVARLKAELERVPKENAEDAEVVVESTETLVAEVNKEKPNRRKLEITGKGMVEAAEALAKVTPTVLPIVNEIMKFFG